MKILITGSTGLIGSELKNFLIQNGNLVISLIRNTNQENDSSVFWDYKKKILDLDRIKNIESVIHLSGENISAKRWSKKQKQRILDSRIQSTNFLINALIKSNIKTKTFLCASAIGIYGNRGDEELSEKSQKGEGFLADVCAQWEKLTTPAKDAGVRVVNLRFGVILSRNGGALKKMLLPFKIGLGGRTGNGRQYISWIALEDVASAIQFIIDNDNIEGPVNFVSPNPVTNEYFSKALAKALRRPAIFPLPAIAARLIFGEMADELLLSGTRVVPKILLENGFKFQHDILEDTFKKLLDSK